jgi:MFS family permease
MALGFVTIGVGFYSQVILLDGLCTARGWSRASVSGASSLYFLVSVVTGALIGRAIDRYGARGWILGGVCLMAVALLGIVGAETPGQLLCLYPFMAVGFGMSAGVPTNAIITRWFVFWRARAMSIAHTGISMGGVVLVPLATWLIRSDGLEAAIVVLVLLLVGIAIPITLLVLRWDPGAYGLVPDGGAEAPVENPLLSEVAQQRSWRARQALQTSTFWVLAVAFAGILFCQMSLLIHQLSFLGERMDPAAASFAVSTTAAGSIVGRLVVGALADRIEKRRLATMLFLVQACALLAFSTAHGMLALYATALLFGSTIGSIFMMQSLLVGELFGMASFGTVFGLLQLLTGTIGALGPGALGLFVESIAGYGTALRFLAAIAVASAWVLSRVQPPMAQDDVAD